MCRSRKCRRCWKTPRRRQRCIAPSSPATSAWIILDRLDLKHDAHSDASSDIESARAINNLNANWQLDQRTQLGLQFGGRYVRSTFDGERYSGLSTLYGVDVRGPAP